MLFILNSNKCSLIYLNGGIMAQKHEREVYKNRLKNIQIEDARRERSASIARQMQFSGYASATSTSSNDDIQKIVELIYLDLRNDKNEENNKLIESNANVIKSALKNAISVTQPATGESLYARTYVIGDGLIHTDKNVAWFCLSAFSRAVVLTLAQQEVQNDDTRTALNIVAFVVSIALMLYESCVCTNLDEYGHELLRWIIGRSCAQLSFSMDEAVEIIKKSYNGSDGVMEEKAKIITTNWLNKFLGFGIIENVGKSEFRLCDVVTIHLQKKSN